MQFGKPEDPDKVVFELPGDRAINVQSFGTLKVKSQLYTGGTGWGTKEWKGKLYPPKTPAKNFLFEYSKQYRTVELNSFFYNIPKESTIQNWYESVPEDFKFCPKVLKYISQSKNLGVDTDRIIRFQDSIALFKDKLGPSFLQLPPHFDVSRFSVLEQFLKVFGSDLPLAVEFRHPSWFDSDAGIDRMLELLRKHGKGAVITDVGGRRDVCHMGITAPYAFIRFVGNDLHTSDYQRIEKWKDRVMEWFGARLNEVYFFIHEPNNMNAPEISSYLHRIFPKDTIFSKRGPILYEKEDQLNLF